MNISKVTDGIFKLSIDLEDALFEGMWPVPNGVTMNSYVVKGEKTALVDGICGWDGMPESLIELLKKLDIEIPAIDYIIVNHMEPDHSGWMEKILQICPDCRIVTGKKSVPLLKAFFEFEGECMVVGEGDTLDLGGGRVLSFHDIPNVHWPETIATFDTLSGTLFPCDAFGSYGIAGENGYDDMLSPDQLATFEQDAIRYYANIVAAFSAPTSKAIQKCAPLPIKIIAPGHGLVWRKDPMKIVNDYIRYASYQKGPCENEITLIWGSMYSNTEKAVLHAIEALKKEDITLHVHRVPEDHCGEILTSVWSSTGLILAMPTYEYKMFPPMAAVLDELCRKKVQNRKVFRFGSFGWSGGAQKELDEIVTRNKIKWEFLEPVEFQGSAKAEHLEQIEKQCAELVKMVKEAVAAKEEK